MQGNTRQASKTSGEPAMEPSMRGPVAASRGRLYIAAEESVMHLTGMVSPALSVYDHLDPPISRPPLLCIMRVPTIGARGGEASLAQDCSQNR
ncbi:hypothetical protein GGTG_02604 [Gaeumannomyces tritici R3-111a-1]|uniref:Uncharacterized protein n=1 Tax=Gaeumannomyces tritici (strain R3-111a-1) TaxID=644352 RepID=J3NMU5_GAET3|nr:hypothetical protein GGTG_02604 [Gaeumannomyces tritici R3-111a-1]EJT77496.1 hypothetical protein GGTG_02604 [Gaeumannomyces tritici R3-111a-1]